MATAPSVIIGSISSGISATRPIKAINLSNARVTVGDPIETTVSYYTGPRSSQATLSNLALQLTTDTSGTLSTHYVEYGNSVQYNQSIGLRCVVSNSSGLSSEDLGFDYGNIVFFPVPKVTSVETDNGDNTITTVFTLEFDNGTADTSVKVQYRSASGHITSYNSSAWSSWTTSNQETIAAGETGTQTIHYTVTTASNAEMSFNFRLTTGSGSWSDYSRTIFYANPNVHLYGSVSQTTITGVTGEIRSGGAGNISSFDANTFWANHASFDSLNVNYISVEKVQLAIAYNIVLYFSDGTPQQTLLSGGVPRDIANYGINLNSVHNEGTDYIDLTPTTVTVDATKEIVKLYGSVGGQTKSIQKLYGSVNGQTKRIF